MFEFLKRKTNKTSKRNKDAITDSGTLLYGQNRKQTPEELEQHRKDSIRQAQERQAIEDRKLSLFKSLSSRIMESDELLECVEYGSLLNVDMSTGKAMVDPTKKRHELDHAYQIQTLLQLAESKHMKRGTMRLSSANVYRLKFIQQQAYLCKALVKDQAHDQTTKTALELANYIAEMTMEDMEEAVLDLVMDAVPDMEHLDALSEVNLHTGFGVLGIGLEETEGLLKAAESVFDITFAIDKTNPPPLNNGMEVLALVQTALAKEG